MAFGLKMRKFEKSEIESAHQARRRHPRHRRPAAPQAAPALGRPAPAGGARPRHRARSQGLPVRRAAQQPRRQAARADAGRAQEAARAAGHHGDLRHPRPGRGDDAGRPRRGDEGRAWSSRSASRSSSTTRPANRFVAGFIGSPAMNFADVTLADNGGRPMAEAPGLRIGLPERAGRSRQRPQRPQGHARHPSRGSSISRGRPIAPEHCFEASVEVVEQLGSEILLDTRVGAGADGGERRADGAHARPRQAQARDEARPPPSVRRRDRSGDLQSSLLRTAGLQARSCP